MLENILKQGRRLEAAKQGPGLRGTAVKIDQKRFPYHTPPQSAGRVDPCVPRRLDFTKAVCNEVVVEHGFAGRRSKGSSSVESRDCLARWWFEHECGR